MNVKELSRYMRQLRFVAFSVQIKENISVRRQTLTYAGRAWSLYISFQNYNIQEGTGKVIYQPSTFDEEQLHLKQDRSRSHKSAVSSVGL